MAYSEIMEILHKITAVKTVGKLLLADFMAIVLIHRETTVLILACCNGVFFLLFLVINVCCLNMCNVLKGLSSICMTIFHLY